MVGGVEELSEEERRALRGSKFAPLPSLPPPRSQPRLAHPGGPLTTNKAAALAKFLERKMQDPNGLASINPDLVELAVKNAKDTVLSSGTSNLGKTIRHVASFGDAEDSSEENIENSEDMKKKKKKRKKKKKEKKKEKNNKKLKLMDHGNATLKGPKRKLKL